MPSAICVGLMRRPDAAAGVLSGLLIGAPFGMRGMRSRPFEPRNALC